MQIHYKLYISNMAKKYGHFRKRWPEAFWLVA